MRIVSNAHMSNIGEGCLLFREQDSACVTCTEYMVSARSSSNAKERRQLKPAHFKVPVA